LIELCETALVISLLPSRIFFEFRHDAPDWSNFELHQ